MGENPSKNHGRRTRESDRDGVFRDFLQGIPSDMRAPVPESPRGRILGAARSLFADRGFEGTSTRAIAGKAGVNQAMIHYYFGTKAQLYRRIISLEIIDVFRGISAHLDSEKTPEAVLVNLPLELMGELRKDPVRANLLRREIGQGGEHAGQAILWMREFGPLGLKKILVSLLDTGRRKGRIRSLSSEATLPFLLSVAYGAIMLEPLFRVVLGKSAKDERVWRRRRTTFEALLRHGLLAEETES